MKCNYNGCSSKCKGDIDVNSCNVLRAYQQGRIDKYQEIVSEYMLLTPNQVEEIREDAVGDYLTFVRENADKYCDDPNDGWSMVDLIELCVEWQKSKQ